MSLSDSEFPCASASSYAVITGSTITIIDGYITALHIFTIVNLTIGFH